MSSDEIKFDDELCDDSSKLDDNSIDAELQAIKERVFEMEAEANKLHEINDKQKSPLTSASQTPSVMSDEEKNEVDLRSVYVGNVDYGASAEELSSLFGSCGAVNRVTILCNVYTGQPKGYAYIEFENVDAVEAACALDGSNFRQRELKVLPKRRNVPGMSTTNRPPRRGFRGGARGGFRGGQFPVSRRGYMRSR
ncbi:Polyadenylate-binding protein 2 [Cichlidogyrus casuarinus]|uniref:Polyadenylate-binding protein 2 n=1 Tax=Cichlidogyrus casuarinus TaxID=1844966 RepID=A0ABD2QIB5_9PLAT